MLPFPAISTTRAIAYPFQDPKWPLTCSFNNKSNCYSVPRPKLPSYLQKVWEVLDEVELPVADQNLKRRKGRYDKVHEKKKSRFPTSIFRNQIRASTISSNAKKQSLFDILMWYFSSNGVHFVGFHKLDPWECFWAIRNSCEQWKPLQRKKNFFFSQRGVNGSRRKGGFPHIAFARSRALIAILLCLDERTQYIFLVNLASQSHSGDKA